MSKCISRILPLLVLTTLAGCAAPAPPLSDAHLARLPIETGRNDSPADIPPLATSAPPLPAPAPSASLEVYSVVVNNVPVHTLLFAMARDAKLNLDVHPGITGLVTLNALDQTIHQILERVARQVDIRWELSGNNLYVLPDSPFLRLYKIDYPNIARESDALTSSQAQVATTGGAAGGSGASGNASSAQIRNQSSNRFWETLAANLRDILRETDRVIQDSPVAAVAPAPTAMPSAEANLVAGRSSSVGGSQTVTISARPLLPAPAVQPQYREAASVISNPETGVVSVRATLRQHQKVREFIDQVVSSSRRQVLIEATIVEVGLTQEYQQGINWSVLRQAVSGNTDLSFVQQPGGGSSIATGLAQPFLGALTFARRGSNFDLSATIRLLESFGRTRVLSSPKISVINNQSALLKVVDNKVYFTVSVTPGSYDAGTGRQLAPPVYTTQVNTVPVGFLMNVLPQVGDDNSVTLNLRPTVSRITSYAIDPNPALAQANVTNRIPEIQTREFESIMKVRDGEIAVMGGLMQDDQSRTTDQIPGAGELPVVGELLRYRNNRSAKSELVIFLRPTILNDASIEGDQRMIRRQLSMRSSGNAP